jgi:cyclic dehypoxanthinyl futalosine synthase
MPLRDVLLRLQEAGLNTIPGGGGEILVDRVRRRIGQGKTLTAEWLEVMRQAHRLGMKTSCTMMFGHIETIEERIEHLRVLRDLQDETGGFTAFIHWPFQPEGTTLGKWKRLPAGAECVVQNAGSESPNAECRMQSAENAAAASPSSAGADTSFFVRHSATGLRPLPDGEHLLLADGHEYLVMLAIARLYLDNIPNIQSSWVTMGPKIGQLALFYGANDMGSVMMEENVVSQAGATYRLSEDHIRRIISDSGWVPQQRDQYYRPITTPRGTRPALSATTASPEQSRSDGTIAPGAGNAGPADDAAARASSDSTRPVFVPLSVAGHE